MKNGMNIRQVVGDEFVTLKTEKETSSNSKKTNFNF